MIKHVVMWKLKDMESLQKSEVISNMKKGLEALVGQVDGLTTLEVGADFLQSDQSYDVVLISTHPSKAGLEAYQVHPLHQEAAAALVKPFASARASVDFEY